MEEILRAKLTTITEEPENCEENQIKSPRQMRIAKKQVKKNKNIKQSYVLFINGFVSKSNFGGFLQH